MLFDTVRGKKAGDFSFADSIPDLEDLMLEIAYRGDVDNQIDQMMNSFREGDEEVAKSVSMILLRMWLANSITALYS